VSIEWSYFRDEIILNDAFRAELKSEVDFRAVPQGSTLLLGARIIRHETDYAFRFEGYNLILLAGLYDAGGGSIDVSGHAGTSGQSGQAGREGYASAGGANNRPGGSGAPGAAGSRGSNGMSVTVFCERLLRASLVSNGGSGGGGGAGGNGGKGGNGSEGKYPHYEGWEGTSGGAGGSGGAGASGAPAGTARISFIEAATGHVPDLQVAGGAGGAGGGGGNGGKKGTHSLDASDGANGAAGSPGARGADGQASAVQVEAAKFWDGIRALTGEYAAEWAAYRVRVGEFYFRAFNPQPDRAPYLALAADEFLAALRLVPENPRARVYLDQINANQNILGMARDFDLIPDFPRYERVITDYAPLVLIMFETSLKILEQAYDVAGNKARLAGQIPHVEESINVLSVEKNAAALGAAEAKSDFATSEARINALNAELEANRVALEKWNFEFEARRIQSVFQVCVAIVAVIGAAYTGGASLAAVPALLVSAQSAWKEFEYDKETKTVTYRAKGLVDWFTWKDGKPTLKPEILALVKGLEDVVKKSIDIIDKVKVLTQIDAGTVDGQLMGEGKRLVQRSAELALERASAALNVKRATLLTEAVDLRIEQASADIGRIKVETAALSADVRLLGQIARILVKSAQQYVDVITKYVFLAARALEIYTLSDLSDEIAFDYGYIHPDTEENAYLSLSRGDASHVLALMQNYIVSWNRLPGVIAYRDTYETYRMGLTGDLQFWTYKDPAVLQRMRDTGQTEFRISLDELLPGRWEAKVDAVYISLVGATAADPRITCIVEHTGQGLAKRRDGTVVEISAPPRMAPVAAAKLDGELGGPPSFAPLPFWGRTPAAKWRLAIEPEVMARSAVDLSALSAVQIAITYQSI
jgi:hypothetical protein